MEGLRWLRALNSRRAVDFYRAPKAREQSKERGLVPEFNKEVYWDWGEKSCRAQRNGR
jgi:hypothetical protein